MYAQYGNVAIQCEQILEFTQTPVYSEDGVDFTMTDIRLRVRGVWNPALTFATDGDGNPMVAAATIEEVRQTLLQPRQLLKVRVPNNGNSASNILIVSPMLDPNGSRYPCDAKNGPFVVGWPIIEVIGEKSAILEFSVQTTINECDNAYPLVSHRWQAVHSIDREEYCTRTIQGIALFRTDVMQRNALLPDDFRWLLVHQCPNGFKRENLVVEASSDGTALRYTVVDQEKPLVAADKYKGITSIRGTYTYEKGVGTASMKNATAGATTGFNAGGPVGAGVGFAVGLIADVAGIFPPAVCRLNVQVTGSKTTTRATLLNTLGRVVSAFHFDGDNFDGLYGAALRTISLLFVHKIITVDIFEKVAEITCWIRIPSELNAWLKSSAGGGLIAKDFLPPILDYASIPENISDVYLAVNDTGHSFQGDRGTRGSYVAHLASQVLSTPCTGPKKPDPRNREKTNCTTPSAFNTPQSPTNDSE